MRSSKVPPLGTFLLILAFVLAACAPAATKAPTAVIPVTGGTGTPAAGASNSSSSSGGSSANNSTLNIGSNPKLGAILVGPTGMTLYEFAGDAAGVSNCDNTCIQTWPPLGVPGGLSPVLGYGVGGDLSTIIRPDGSSQVTLDGAPLYYFTGDKIPGDANGAGFGGKWFAVAPDGSRIKVGGAFTPTTSVDTATPTPAPATATATPTVPSVTKTPLPATATP
jgi:predicted lipoprotein with Yx(FWY)xxD motif